MVRHEEGSIAAGSLLRMQEMPAQRSHHLKTHQHVQHIFVTRLQTTFSPLVSSDVFPGLHGMTHIRRNPKVDFEELLLALQQDPAIPAPSICDYGTENEIRSCHYCNQPHNSQPLLRLLLCLETPTWIISADARGPRTTAIPLLIRRCQQQQQ